MYNAIVTTSIYSVGIGIISQRPFISYSRSILTEYFELVICKYHSFHTDANLTYESLGITANLYSHRFGMNRSQLASTSRVNSLSS